MTDFDLPPFPDDEDEPNPEYQPDDDDGSEFADLLETLGIASIEDVIIDISDVENLDDLRGVRFETLEEAIIYLYNIGVISFSDIVMIDDLYAVAIPDDTPPGRFAVST